MDRILLVLVLAPTIPPDWTLCTAKFARCWNIDPKSYYLDMILVGLDVKTFQTRFAISNICNKSFLSSIYFAFVSFVWKEEQVTDQRNVKSWIGSRSRLDNNVLCDGASSMASQHERGLKLRWIIFSVIAFTALCLTLPIVIQLELDN